MEGLLPCRFSGGVFLAMLAMATLTKETLGIESYLAYGVALWFIVVAPVTAIVYWIFPLQLDQVDVRDKDKD